MRFLILLFWALLLHAMTPSHAQIAINDNDFASVDLNSTPLADIRQLVTAKKYDKAAKALLAYYRKRTSPALPGIIRLTSDRTLPAGIKESADNALLHQFRPHKGYGYFDYGKDKINWLYLPNKEYEVKVQLHRLGWWLNLAKAYQATGNEAYAKEFVYQFTDWNKEMAYNKSRQVNEAAWRPLEVCGRAKVFVEVFDAFVQSPHFTPQFLLSLLKSTAEHTDFVMNHYSARGNHLLFEAEAIIKVGAFLPELKQAATWRKSGINVLVAEIDKQVKPDGFQWEMSPNYHMAMISTFWNSYEMSKTAGLGNEFPDRYKQTVEKMAMAMATICFPDYTFPLYGDAWAASKPSMLANFEKWSSWFPANQNLTYFATERKKGIQPDYLSKGLTDIGFYTFRNSWADTATVMMMKASQPGEFHAQPDNGTFELWVNGRNFTPDAGAFVYGGDAEITKLRDWYRQTRVHSTLTLDNKNMNITQADVKEWQTSENLDILSYNNPSYQDLIHNRTVFFINKQYFLIIDRALGVAPGNVGIHYVLKEDCQPVKDEKNNRIYTTYKDGNNLLIQYIGNDKPLLKEEEGKVSYEYQKEAKRPAFVFEKTKDNHSQCFVTILYPYKGNQVPKVQLKENKDNNFIDGKLDISIEVNGKQTTLKTQL